MARVMRRMFPRQRLKRASALERDGLCTTIRAITTSRGNFARLSGREKAKDEPPHFVQYLLHFFLGYVQMVFSSLQTRTC